MKRLGIDRPGEMHMQVGALGKLVKKRAQSQRAALLRRHRRGRRALPGA